MSRSIWLKAESWPVILTLGLGIGVCAFHCSRTLLKHNDIVFNKSKPLQIDDQPSPKYVSYEQSVRLGQKYFRY